MKIQVIPNGADLQALAPHSLEPGQPPRLVFAGRFVAQKAPVQAVRILAALSDQPWKYTMLGDGPLRPEVEREIAAHGLQERIHLPGWVTPEEVAGVFRHSDILFMPSRSEGLPVVGVQALATALAIVASRVGGWVDLVKQGENGFLHAPEDQAAFVESLRLLVQDGDRLRQFRQKSQEHAARFDLRAVGQAYEAVLNQVVGKTVDANPRLSDGP